MICLIMLTILLSGLTAYYTDGAKMVSRKRTILVTSTTLSLETVVTILMLRRSLLEAIVLGLFPLIFGSMFMLNLENLV